MLYDFESVFLRWLLPFFVKLSVVIAQGGILTVAVKRFFVLEYLCWLRTTRYKYYYCICSMHVNHVDFMVWINTPNIKIPKFLRISYFWPMMILLSQRLKNQISYHSLNSVLIDVTPNHVDSTKSQNWNLYLVYKTKAGLFVYFSCAHLFWRDNEGFFHV